MAALVPILASRQMILVVQFYYLHYLVRQTELIDAHNKKTDKRIAS